MIDPTQREASCQLTGSKDPSEYQGQRGGVDPARDGRYIPARLPTRVLAETSGHILCDLLQEFRLGDHALPIYSSRPFTARPRT